MQSLLNLAEAAEVLGYSVSGFRKLLRAGRGPQFMRAGRGNYRFRPEWLEGFAEQAASPSPKRKPHPPIQSSFGLDSRL